MVAWAGPRPPKIEGQEGTNAHKARIARVIARPVAEISCRTIGSVNRMAQLAAIANASLGLSLPLMANGLRNGVRA